MDRIPGACAMDWSTDLDKSLRSKNPGRSIEAIKEIGCRLEWWDRDSKLTVAAYKYFGLIPGEDKLFLNAIFLRLADLFRLGDKNIKSCIVKIFLSLRRKRRRSKVKDDNCGILSQGKLENYIELLRRVKVVFDRGDVEERAMALILFGCWADFAKDVADIRYIVLSSLVSDDAYQVKASLFAAGCFCQLSDDFGNVFLEILTRLVISPDIPRAERLAGVRAFAKLWCPFSVADKAYKTGLRLLKDSLEDDFTATMLISLSKIASKWTYLIPAQIELLTLFLSEERYFVFQATTLRCLNFTITSGCSGPSASNAVHELLIILNGSEISQSLQFEALEILRKLLLYDSSLIPSTEMLALFPNLLIVVENIVRSSSVSKRLLVFSFLSDLSGKLLGRADIASSGTGSTLASSLISFVLDRISLLVRLETDRHLSGLDLELEVKSSLNLLVNLVESQPYLSYLFLDYLIKMLGRVVRTEKSDLPSLDTSEVVGGSRKLLYSKVMLYLSKVVATCVRNLDVTDVGTSQVVDALKHQVEHVIQCTSFDIYIRMIYCLLLRFCAIHSCIFSEKLEFMTLDKNFTLPCIDSAIQLDIFSLDCAKELLGVKAYWSCYKAGKLAACQGAWSAAAFIFEHICMMVKSSSCSNWLNSLARFSQIEKKIQLFFTPDNETSVLNPLTLKEPSVPSEDNLGIRGDISWKIKQRDCIKNLMSASNGICTVEEMLASSDMRLEFSFQTWFLSLRAKALASVADTMTLLNKMSLVQDSTSPIGQGYSISPVSSFSCLQRPDSLVSSFSEVSCRLNRLAREFDLFLTSFLGMDGQSASIVSALALSCSLMAFSAGAVFLISNLQFSENIEISTSNEFKEPFCTLLVEDLVGRLRHIDNAARRLLISKSFWKAKSSFSPRLRNQISDSYENRVMFKICDCAIMGIIALQNAARKKQQSEGTSQTIKDGSQLLFNIMSQCVLIPFRTPKHFFQVRARVSSELFVMNEDGKYIDGISVFPGSPLSLSLGLQLRNMPTGASFGITKLFCILSCETSSQMTTEGMGKSHLSSQEWQIDDLIDLNEKLLGYVSGSSRSWRIDSREKAGSFKVDQYVRFDLNSRGQGFSNCLLNVSAFPAGSYRIKWHSCCIDSGGSYWSLLPLNAGPVFAIQNRKNAR